MSDLKKPVLSEYTLSHILCRRVCSMLAQGMLYGKPGGMGVLEGSTRASQPPMRENPAAAQSCSLLMSGSSRS